MLTYEVKGLPHVSGREELDGPVLLLRKLVRLQEFAGIVKRVIMGIYNMEVVNILNDKEWRQMPPRACARNVDLRLQMEALK